MCGIAGIILKTQTSSIAPEALEGLALRLAHRGPDGQSIMREPGRGFVNRRLAIVDIVGGEQPVFSEDGSIGCVYNGEIYNYLELRHELQQRGHVFKSHSDTEVLVHLFEEQGANSFARLRGMFAFALWTPADVYLVRDQLGIKPLYIYEDQEKLLFSSEIQAFQAIPNLDWRPSQDGLVRYLTFRYVTAPQTIFANVRKLQPASFIRAREGQFDEARYWHMEAHSRPWKVEDAKEALRERLRRSVASQLIGEVPIGLLLSGGLDSSSLAWALHVCGVSIKSFNVGFHDVNEFAYSDVVAKRFNLPHWLTVMKEQEMGEYVRHFLRAIDEPIADAACIALFRLCEEVRNHVTVVLSGEGADELFAGYPQYWKIARRHKRPDLSAFESFLDESYYFRDGYKFLESPMRDGWWNDSTFRQNDLLNGMLAYDLETWLPDDLMMKADKILMANSLEGRFPFLDLDLLEFAFSLPTELKLRDGGAGKWILREAMKDLLPIDCLTRPKMGFTVPVDQILTSCQRTGLDAITEKCALDGLINKKRVLAFIEDYYAGKHQKALQAWTLFVLYYWFQENYPRA